MKQSEIWVGQDKRTLLERIKEWWLFKKIHLMYVYQVWTDKGMRAKYCRKGFHKIRNHTYSYGGTGYKRRVVVRAIKCDYCKYMFFACQRDKDKYQEQEKKSKDMFSAFFKSSSGGNRKITTAGKDKKRELSDSSSSVKKKVK